MPLRKLTIATRLRLGLGLILLLTLILGAAAWIQTDRLWDQTRQMYEHSLTVRRAVGALLVDFERMSREAHDLFLAEGEQEIADSLQGIEIAEADAWAQLAILDARYLGPREDIAGLRGEFLKWVSSQDETVRLFRAGAIDDARARVRPGGVHQVQAEALRTASTRVDAFAHQKAEQFYETARAQTDEIKLQLAVIIAVIALVSLVVARLLLDGIRGPLKQLTAATEQFRQGALDARSPYVATDEIGTLSAAFNAMAESIQTETQLNEQAAKLTGVLLRGGVGVGGGCTRSAGRCSRRSWSTPVPSWARSTSRTGRGPPSNCSSPSAWATAGGPPSRPPRQRASWGWPWSRAGSSTSPASRPTRASPSPR